MRSLCLDTLSVSFLSLRNALMISLPDLHASLVDAKEEITVHALLALLISILYVKKVLLGVLRVILLSYIIYALFISIRIQ